MSGSTYQVLADDGTPLEAHYDLDDGAIIVRSRGGSAKSGRQVNPEYGPGLRLLLRRLLAAGLTVADAWVDSGDAQALPLPQRRIVTPGQAPTDPESLFRELSNRMKAVGRPVGASTTGGNATKRIRLVIAPKRTASELNTILGGRPSPRDYRSDQRLPVADLELVTVDHIWRAVGALLDGRARRDFGPSTHFDLVLDDGTRLPPMQVFGLAASEALDFTVTPNHFSGGDRSPCFRVLRQAGFTIVPKGSLPEPKPAAVDLPLYPDDAVWSEGRPRLAQHIRRERSRVLAQIKKADFKKCHGALRCEHCGLDPIAAFGGLIGEACIEVHHHTTAVREMEDDHSTRLKDVICLCANCHRVEHRRLREALT